jgi:hypothetical protein
VSPSVFPVFDLLCRDRCSAAFSTQIVAEAGGWNIPQ